MQFHKLFNTLVVSGSMLALSACATSPKGQPDPGAGSDEGTPEPATTAETETPVETDALNCEAVCESLNGRESMCPDPLLGTINCCWLMSEQHPCCDLGEKVPGP